MPDKSEMPIVDREPLSEIADAIKEHAGSVRVLAEAVREFTRVLQDIAAKND